MSEVSFYLRLGAQEPFELEIDSSREVLAAAPEAQIAAALLPAMQEGADVRVDDAIDPVFADSLATIQDIYATWYDEAERITVQVPEEESAHSTEGERTATFFTGGVDSFYTLLKHETEIDTLVFIHGFDIALDDTSLRWHVSKMLYEVAEHFGKDVIEVETNLRDFSDSRVSWERYHGAALAVIALTLKRSVEKIFIPSSRPYDLLKPWGSSPLLDPLWSTRQIEFVHDGCEANRMEKCDRLAENDVALETLRVCWENRSGAYNCGRCEKCVRTMVQLLAAGALDRCTTFSEPLDPSRIQDFPAVRNRSFRYVPPLRRLEADDRAPSVRDAIREGLKEPSMIESAIQIAEGKWRTAWHHFNSGMQSWGLRE